MKFTLPGNMKKAAGLASGALMTLMMAGQAFASGTSLDPCPKDSQFNTLCKLQANQLGSVVSNAVTIILIVATLIALFFLIWGGVRWITSGGDKAKVDEARKTIIGAIIGLVIAFLAYFILTIVLSIFGLSLNKLQLPTVFK
jgi:hypothetical protein